MIKIKEHYILITFLITIFISFSVISKKVNYHSSPENLKQLLIKNNQIREAFFTTKHSIKKLIIDLILNEKKSIKAAAFLLTDRDIAGALIQAKKINQIKIEVIACYTGLLNYSNKLTLLSQNNIDVYIFNIPISIMHNKFFVFEQNIEDKKIVVTGSYNLTNKAQEYNRENMLVLEDNNLAKCYETEFEDIKKESRLLTKNQKPKFKKFHKKEIRQMSLGEKFKETFNILAN